MFLATLATILSIIIFFVILFYGIEKISEI